MAKTSTMSWRTILTETVLSVVATVLVVELLKSQGHIMLPEATIITFLLFLIYTRLARKEC